VNLQKISFIFGLVLIRNLVVTKNVGYDELYKEVPPYSDSDAVRQKYEKFKKSFNGTWAIGLNMIFNILITIRLSEIYSI